MSWTTWRTPGALYGCNFYFSQYGVRVQQACNTLIAWHPKDAHGSSLPNAGPDEENPTFSQRVLAFVTSTRLAGAWEDFQKGKVSRKEAVHIVETASEDDHGAIYERVK